MPVIEIRAQTASVPGFIGFAVGRTTFWDAVAAYEAHTMTRHEASTRVAQRYREWATIFERTHSSTQTDVKEIHERHGEDTQRT